MIEHAIYADQVSCTHETMYSILLYFNFISLAKRVSGYCLRTHLLPYDNERAAASQSMCNFTRDYLEFFFVVSGVFRSFPIFILFDFLSGLSDLFIRVDSPTY